MAAETPPGTPANPSPFVRIAEGLGPEALYYCQLETMLGTLLGRLLVVGLYCLVIAGWQGALIGMALLLVLGWRQILRHKDRPDLLRYNRNRYIWAGVLLAVSPLLIRLLYALLQAKAPDVLDAWLQFTAPVMEHLSQHLSIFQEMRNMHALLFAATEPAKIPRLDLALHMNMVHWLSIPAALLFAPLLVTHLRQTRLLTGMDCFRLIRNFIIFQFITVGGMGNIYQYLGETSSFRMKSMQFGVSASLFVQIGGFLALAATLIYAVGLINVVFSSVIGEKKLRIFSTRYLGV